VLLHLLLGLSVAIKLSNIILDSEETSQEAARVSFLFNEFCILLNFLEQILK
jgi:hypothetical protein